MLRICKTAKNIDEALASQYYDSITVGIDFTARDLQSRCKANGHPWEIAKAFDCSAPMGKFKKFDELKCKENVEFGMKLNGQWAQQGHSSDMIFGFNKLIAHVSRFVTLQSGDCVFTGTPQGVADRLERFLENELVLDFEVK